MRKIKRWIGIVFAVLIACVAALAIKGPPKVPADAIAHAVNHDSALLERAWALPVARLYHHDVYWQKNGSSADLPPCSICSRRRVSASR